MYGMVWYDWWQKLTYLHCHGESSKDETRGEGAAVDVCIIGEVVEGEKVISVQAEGQSVDSIRRVANEPKNREEEQDEDEEEVGRAMVMKRDGEEGCHKPKKGGRQEGR